MADLDGAVLEKLIAEMVTADHMLVVIDSGDAVSEMSAGGSTLPNFKNGWATIEAEGWHVHLKLESVDGVQFVEAEDHGHDISRLYYLRLSDAEGGTLLRFYFPNPWLDGDEKPTAFQPEKLAAFEAVKDRYVGEPGIVFVRRGPDEG